MVVENSVSTVAKVRETEINRYLEIRPKTGAGIERIPGVEFDSRCEVRTSAPPADAGTAGHFDSPEISLRHHSDVACLPRQIALQGGVALPATYRHNAKPRLRNPGLLDWSPEFVAADYSARPVPGRFFYLDNRYRGHFGHALTEQISQLWGWQRAKERYPDLRALVFEQARLSLRGLEYTLLEAGGISRDKVYVASEPIEVETLVVASQMFSMPEFVHPEIVHTYQAVGDALEEADRLGACPAASSAPAGAVGRVTTATRSKRPSPMPASRWSTPRTIR